MAHGTHGKCRESGEISNFPISVLLDCNNKIAVTIEHCVNRINRSRIIHHDPSLSLWATATSFVWVPVWQCSHSHSHSHSHSPHFHFQFQFQLQHLPHLLFVVVIVIMHTSSLLHLHLHLCLFFLLNERPCNRDWRRSCRIGVCDDVGSLSQLRRET